VPRARTQNTSLGPGVSPRAEARTEDEQRLLEVWLRDTPRAMLRWEAHELFQVSLWDGVDVVVTHARNLFDAIAPTALATSAGASDQEKLRHALNICVAIVALAFMGGRKDLEDIVYSLQSGRDALEEHDRGFEHPLLRVRPRSANQSRESLHDWFVKAACAEACEALLKFGVKDAARQVADVINRKQLLPLKTSGKAVVARSVMNWYARRRAGNLRPIWPAPQGWCIFPKAFKLWSEGKPDAARHAVLRSLPRHVKVIRSW
jgi:hypothetical protein